MNICPHFYTNITAHSRGYDITSWNVIQKLIHKLHVHCTRNYIKHQPQPSYYLHPQYPIRHRSISPNEDWEMLHHAQRLHTVSSAFIIHVKVWWHQALQYKWNKEIWVSAILWWTRFQYIWVYNTSKFTILVTNVNYTQTLTREEHSELQNSSQNLYIMYIHASPFVIAAILPLTNEKRHKTRNDSTLFRVRS
jgi:hypothetical protein